MSQLELPLYYEQLELPFDGVINVTLPAVTDVTPADDNSEAPID